MHHHHFDLFNIIAGSAVRGVVYNIERGIFKGMPLPMMVAVGAGIIGVVWLLTRRR